MAVLLPVDQLLELWPDEFRGVRAGALLHPASVNSKLEHSARIFERENGRLFHLRALFGPQHGCRGETQDNMIEWRSYEHPRLGIPVYSFTANTANRHARCCMISICCWSTCRMWAHVTTLLFGRCIWQSRLRAREHSRCRFRSAKPD